MSYLDKIMGWLNLPQVADQYSFWMGMIIMGGVVISIIIIGVIVRLFRRPAKAISIKSTKGEMQVSLSALKEFIHSSLKDISYIKVSKVSLSGSKSSQRIKLTISAPRGKNLPDLNNEIREKIDRGLEYELGIKTVRTDLISLKRFNGKLSGESCQYTSTPEIVPHETVAEEILLEENQTLQDGEATS